ncbi:hypothetical protein CYMTET_9443 [Cymbomonas tetramitiformis]|uniref:Uncharacterized protein n=1 Tax=Cymbomonas tetramitiformis TaxID=36881 RepID=A0AAE0GRG2_9CHLO|nr:hypothetical protein CYMTET_9441 [Cymbomonas tetramitiformis]KAK3282836.1 hypothetical protein CYMTET_9442 [Cymbomonas tetramitiformis]KAK3282837.1 hypothetical protein CYMTET_9443 [Cymbomonas tetramitiformis]
MDFTDMQRLWRPRARGKYAATYVSCMSSAAIQNAPMNIALTLFLGHVARLDTPNERFKKYWYLVIIELYPTGRVLNGRIFDGKGLWLWGAKELRLHFPSGRGFRATTPRTGNV